LTTIVDSRGSTAASAPVYFTFAAKFAHDNVDDAASATITAGHIVMGAWGNGLAGFGYAPTLTVAQTRLVYATLQGHLTWAITGNKLVMTRAGGNGSLRFVRAPTRKHPFGTVSGHVILVGPHSGPSGTAANDEPVKPNGTGTVSFTDTATGTTQVAAVRKSAYGTFLPPGRYRVEWHMSYASGLSCSAISPVTIAANEDATSDLVCQR
jgi:hypothetical protein